MYYIYKSPTSNNFVHVTSNEMLYAERYLLDEFESRQDVENFARKLKKEICWCDEEPIPHSLS